MKKTQSLKLSASVQTIPIIIGYGAVFIATPFIVTQLGLVNFGLWALTGAVAQYGVLLDFGISRGVVRFVASYHAQGEESKERAVVGVSVLVISLVGSVLVFLSLFMSRQFGQMVGIRDASLARALFLTSASVLVTGMLGVVFVGASIGRGRVVAANLGLACQRASVVLGGVFALIANPGLKSFAYGSAIGGIVGLLIVLLAIFLDEHEIRLGLPRLSIFRELLSFGLKGQVLTICDLIFANSGKIILGIVIGPAAAGAYELASRLALGARSFGSSTSTVLTAHLTRGHASNGIIYVYRDYARLVQRNAMVGNFALFLLASISFGLVPAWLGFQNPDVVLATIILAISYTMNISTGVAMAVTVALNRLGLLAVTAILATTLTVTIQLALVHRLGLLGILAGTAVGSFIGALSGLIVIHRSNGIPLHDFFKPVAGPMLLGIASAALAMSTTIYFHMPADRVSAIPALLVSGSVFCAVYLLIGRSQGFLPTVGKLPARKLSDWRRNGRGY